MDYFDKTKSVFRFKDIKYEAIDVVIGNDIDLIYVFNDGIKSIEHKEKESVIIIEREVYFEPKYLYELTVSIEFKLIHDNFDLSNEDQILNEIIDSVENTSAFERLSLLISNITSAQGNTPIMTPSIFKPLIAK